jgi:biopolymer transport protein ExbB
MQVKAVLVGLVFASFVTWTVWLAKTIEIVLARQVASPVKIA